MSDQVSPKPASACPYTVPSSSPSASAPSLFRAPFLSLNPALSPHSNSSTPRSPLTSAAVSALALSPSATSGTAPFAHTSSVPTTPAASVDAATAQPRSHHAHQPKTHLQRVARATREFRDVWILPE
eukprot:GO256312.1.p2 GENE.GO256312.1~~GO256312.1.p2  ORF type:complete len:143 (+),score=30.39 GO256312.1:50-430(+)